MQAVDGFVVPTIKISSIGFAFVSPDLFSQKIQFIRPGEEYYLFGMTDNWYEIQIKKDVIGYIQIEHAETLSGNKDNKDLDTIDLGGINEASYYNDYLGIGCRLDGWHYYDINELASINNTTKEMLSDNINIAVENNQSKGRYFNCPYR